MSFLSDDLVHDRVRRLVDTAQPEKVPSSKRVATVSALLTVDFCRM